MSSIVEKLEAISARFDELGVALTNPEIVSDNTKFSQISKEYRKLDKIVGIYKIYRGCIDSLAFAREVLETESDEELRQLAKDDLDTLDVKKTELEETLQKTRSSAERLNRDFIDVKETLPETLPTRIIHMLDDYTLVVLLISFFFMVLSLIFIYAATQGYTLMSILKGSGYGLLLSVFMFVFASIVL